MTASCAWPCRKAASPTSRIRWPEQRHIVAAFGFELGMVQTIAIRRRMLGHLNIIHPDLGARVARVLGMEGQAEAIKPARPPVDMAPSPALSMVAKAPVTLAGRKVGILVSDGTDTDLVESLRKAASKAGARFAVVGPKVGGAAAGTNGTIPVDHAVSAGPSLFFDAVVVAVAADGVDALGDDGAAIDWVRNAFGHLKVIGYTSGSHALLGRAGVAAGDGVVAVDGRTGVSAFIDAARHGRIWAREPGIRNPDA